MYWYLHLVHGLDAAQGDVLLPQQLVVSLLAGGGVQLEGEAEGRDKEAAGVARGHPTHPMWMQEIILGKRHPTRPIF